MVNPILLCLFKGSPTKLSCSREIRNRSRGVEEQVRYAFNTSRRKGHFLQVRRSQKSRPFLNRTFFAILCSLQNNRRSHLLEVFSVRKTAFVKVPSSCTLALIRHFTNATALFGPFPSLSRTLHYNTTLTTHCGCPQKLSRRLTNRIQHRLRCPAGCECSKHRKT